MFKLIVEYVAKVRAQNKNYFESRAIELMQKEKSDQLITLQVNIIMKDLRMTRE